MGVVFGDIGTSPLYAFREAVVAASPAGVISRDAVFGVLSLILWALIIVVTCKYVLILLRADNNGEGGTLSLTALASRGIRPPHGADLHSRRHRRLDVSRRFGDHARHFGAVGGRGIEARDAGLRALTSSALTVAILVALFAVQSRGTAKVAAFFGPVMVVWFVAIAIAGLVNIRDDPHVLLAVNPYYGVRFLPSTAISVWSRWALVFLAVTGGEALYADLGHFGRKPIQTAWLFLVFPALAAQLFRPRRLGAGRPDRRSKIHFTGWCRRHC